MPAEWAEQLEIATEQADHLRSAIDVLRGKARRATAAAASRSASWSAHAPRRRASARLPEARAPE